MYDVDQFVTSSVLAGEVTKTIKETIIIIINNYNFQV